MDGQPAGVVPVIVLLDRDDEIAVVTLGQRAGNFVLEVETLAENERAIQRTSQARGVRSSSG
jgi:hypothetical protein